MAVVVAHRDESAVSRSLVRQYVHPTLSVDRYLSHRGRSCSRRHPIVGRFYLEATYDRLPPHHRMTPWLALIEPNWPEMIFELRRLGVSDRDAAKEIGIPLTTYQNWFYRETKPNYMHGQRFVAYHCHIRNTKNEMA